MTTATRAELAAGVEQAHDRLEELRREIAGLRDQAWELAGAGGLAALQLDRTLVALATADRHLTRAHGDATR